METLFELMALPAPTGQEEPVLSWCRRRWGKPGAEITIQPIGNVLARIPGSGPRLLLQGHADEISFVVKSIDDRGFVWLADGQAGSRNPHHRFPVGQPALILGRGAQIPGIFATVTGHVVATLPSDRGPLDENDLFVDLGVSSRAAAEALGVHPGAGVIWNPAIQRLGPRFTGKAIDDRVALALMTHLLEEIDRDALTYDLTIAATVQEEIGLIGAFSLAGRDDFDLAIAIDNGPLGDYPGVDPRELPAALGDGPVVVYKDAWAHYDRRIINRLIEVAESREIPLRKTIYQGFGSDGAALMRAGLPAALLGISTRYTHSPFEMGDERDVIAALELLKAFVTTPAGPLEDGPS